MSNFKMNIKTLIFMIVLIISHLACQMREKKCKYKPSPVFSADLPGVLQYNFEVQGNESLESLFFQSELLLELYQEVCNASKQEYKFTVRGDFSAKSDSLWKLEAVRQLTQLSLLSEKQASLREWAGILEAHRPTMKLAEPIEVQPGIWAKIDRVVNHEQGILLVTFEQK